MTLVAWQKQSTGASPFQAVIVQLKELWRSSNKQRLVFIEVCLSQTMYLSCQRHWRPRSRPVIAELLFLGICRMYFHRASKHHWAVYLRQHRLLKLQEQQVCKINRAAVRLGLVSVWYIFDNAVLTRNHYGRPPHRYISVFTVDFVMLGKFPQPTPNCSIHLCITTYTYM